MLTATAADVSLTAIDTQLPPPGPVRLDATLGVADGKVTMRSFDLGSAPALVGRAPTSRRARSGVEGDRHAPRLPPRPGQRRARTGTWDVTATSDAEGVSLSWEERPTTSVSPGAADLSKMKIGILGRGSFLAFRPVLDAERCACLGRRRGVLTIAARAGASCRSRSVARPAKARLAPARSCRQCQTRCDHPPERSRHRTEALRGGERPSPGPTDVAAPVDVDIALSRDPTGVIQGLWRPTVIWQTSASRWRDVFADRDGLAVPTFQGQWASVVLNVADLAITRTRRSGRARSADRALAGCSTLSAPDLAGSLDLEITAADIPPDKQAALRSRRRRLVTVTMQARGTEQRHHVDSLPRPEGDRRDPLNTGHHRRDAHRRRHERCGRHQPRHGDSQWQQTRTGRCTPGHGSRTDASMRGKVEPDGNDIPGRPRFGDGIRDYLSPDSTDPPAHCRFAHIPGSDQFRLGGGRAVGARHDRPIASDLQLELSALPLSLIDTVAPGNQSRWDGAGENPGSWRHGHTAGRRDLQRHGRALSSSGCRADSSPVGPGIGRGFEQPGERRCSLVSRRRDQPHAQGKATIPSGAGPLSGSATVTGTIDVAPFASLLGNDLRNITGTLRPNLTLDLSGSRISGGGGIDFTNGAVALPESGMRLSGGEGRIALQGDTVQVQRPRSRPDLWNSIRDRHRPLDAAGRGPFTFR